MHCNITLVIQRHVLGHLSSRHVTSAGVCIHPLACMMQQQHACQLSSLLRVLSAVLMVLQTILQRRGADPATGRYRACCQRGAARGMVGAHYTAALEYRTRHAARHLT